MKDAIRELMPVAKLVLGVCLFFWSVDCLVVEDRINSTSVLTIFGLGFWAGYIVGTHREKRDGN
jgi:hypothetical protein